MLSRKLHGPLNIFYKLIEIAQRIFIWTIWIEVFSNTEKSSQFLASPIQSHYQPMNFKAVQHHFKFKVNFESWSVSRYTFLRISMPKNYLCELKFSPTTSCANVASQIEKLSILCPSLLEDSSTLAHCFQSPPESCKEIGFSATARIINLFSCKGG